MENRIFERWSYLVSSDSVASSSVLKYCIKKQVQPTTLDEIWLAIDDAREAEPFGLLTGQPITDSNLFHLAPLLCMKFRGLNYRDRNCGA